MAVGWVLCGGILGLFAISMNDAAWWACFAAATTASLIAAVLTVPLLMMADRRSHSVSRATGLLGILILAGLAIAMTVPLAVSWGGGVLGASSLALVYTAGLTLAGARRPVE